MLKLMKYEFIHSYRTFLISFLIFLVGCLLFPFMIDGVFAGIPLISSLFGVGFVVLLMGISFALFISIFVNYDRSMFKKPGYLTLTLPVSTTQLILSKVLTTIIWLIIALFVLISGFILIALVMMMSEDTLTFEILINSISQFVTYFWEYLINNFADFLSQILFVLGSVFLFVGTIYFTMSAVHTKWFKKHQLIFGIIIYFCINSIISWLPFLLLDSMTFSIVMGASSQTFFIYAFYYIALGALFTLGTIYILNHHLEIE